MLPLYVPSSPPSPLPSSSLTHHTDAEGNGDSISAAVQAERIALLENVLATQVEQTHLRKPAPSALQLPRALPAHLPGVLHSPFVDSPTRSAPLTPLSPASPWPEAAPARFAPQQLPTRPLEEFAPPIYQTPESRGGGMLKNAGSGSLLPGFLADIVHSDAPSLSPSTSTSSAELSLDTDEYDELRRAAHFTYAAAHPHAHAQMQANGGNNGHAARRAGSSTNPLTIHEHSIWKLDGAELNLGGGSGSDRGNRARIAAAKAPTTVPRDLAHAQGMLQMNGGVGAGAGAAGVQGLAAAVAALTIAPGPAGRR